MARLGHIAEQGRLPERRHPGRLLSPLRFLAAVCRPQLPQRRPERLGVTLRGGQQRQPAPGLQEPGSLSPADLRIDPVERGSRDDEVVGSAGAPGPCAARQSRRPLPQSARARSSRHRAVRRTGHQAASTPPREHQTCAALGPTQRPKVAAQAVISDPSARSPGGDRFCVVDVSLLTSRCETQTPRAAARRGRTQVT